MEYFFTAAAALSMIIMIVLAVKNRYLASKCIFYILAGIFLSLFFMVIPVFIIDGEGNAVLRSWLYCFQAMAGRADISQLEFISYKGAAKEIYLFAGHVCMFLAPVFASGLLVSFIGDFSERFLYMFMFSRKEYIFSGINENTLAAAAGIKEKLPGAKIVFCGVKNTEKEVYISTKKCGYILLGCSCADIKRHPFCRDYIFYLMDDDDGVNVGNAERLYERYTELKDGRLEVNVLIHDGSSSSLLEDVINSKASDSEKTGKIRFCREKPSFILKLQNSEELMCSNLFCRYPVYNYVNEDRVIDFMLIGAGRTGRQVIKTVLNQGQIAGVHLKIRVYDSDARRAEAEFLREAPEVRQPCYDIAFINADVNKESFAGKIKESTSADAVVIATGSDKLNIAAAEFLYGYFRKNRNFSSSPVIFTRIKSELIVADYKNNNNNYLGTKNIIPFGSPGEVFGKMDENREKTEKLALAVHLCYSGVKAEELASAVRDFFEGRRNNIHADKYNEFIRSEYNRRSSTASALHIGSKIYGLKLLYPGLFDPEKSDADNFENIIKNTEIKDVLIKNEHDRWNAFMRSDGYTPGDIDAMESLIKEGESKYAPAKLHICLTDFENLREVNNKYNSIAPKTKEFIKYDRAIVECTPEIIRAAEQ